MNKTSKIISLIVGIVIVGLLIISNNIKNPTSEQSIRIGAVLSLAGAASADGEALKQGIEFAKEDLANKGINVEIIYQDDQTESGKTVSAINALVTQNVQAIIGPTWSFLGDAAVPVIDRLKIVSIMPVTTTEVVEGESSYLFHGSIKNQLMQSEFEKLIKEKQIKKLVFIGNNDSWSASIFAPLEQAAKNNGAEIVYKEEIPFGAEAASMPAVVTKIKQIQADAVVFSIFDDQGISKLVTSARQQGITVPIVATDTSLRRVINTGLITSVSLNNLYDVTPETDGTFEKRFEDRYGRKPNTFADRGYDSLMILVDAINNKKDLELKEYLHQKTNYKGYASTYSFDENGDVEGGQWILQSIR